MVHLLPEELRFLRATENAMALRHRNACDDQYVEKLSGRLLRVFIRCGRDPEVVRRYLRTGRHLGVYCDGCGHHDWIGVRMKCRKSLTEGRLALSWRISLSLHLCAHDKNPN